MYIFQNYFNEIVLIPNLKIIVFHFSYANEVSIGDEVLVNENDQLSPAKVIDISTSKMQGDIQIFYSHILIDF